MRSLTSQAAGGVSVALVGAGPGDPGLITVRGLELLRSCDAVVYDRLVAPELVAEAPVGALTIARDGLAQAEINDLLVVLAEQGLDVVRLKGGDPYVFGRGGEEAIALADAGIEFEVVPGVSALASVPASAGIPLTHRGVSSQVRILSGRLSEGDPDWASVRPDGSTFVLFMALNELERVCGELIARGFDPATPSAVISRGTLPDQEIVVAQLCDLAAAAAGLPAPALTIVGDVVGVRERILARPEPAALAR